MADYDRRPRRGGGQFNNRKRRYRGESTRVIQQTAVNLSPSDDDFDDRRPPRRRYEEPIAITLRKQVLGLAEASGAPVEDDIISIARRLADNYFDSDLTSGFVNLATQMYEHTM